MSIFKTIASKVKRVVSLKNVINGVTGNYAAIGLDAIRVATTKKPPSKAEKAAALASNIPYVAPDAAYSTFTMPPMVETALNNAGAKQAEKTIEFLSNQPIMQNNINPANAFMSKLWFQTTWQKNKTLIIVAGVAIAGFIGWKVFGKKTASKGRARR